MRVDEKGGTICLNPDQPLDRPRGQQRKSRKTVRVGACIASVALFAVVLTTVALGGRTADAPIQTIKHSVVQGPWLVWDKLSCSFKTSASHPSTYTSVLRKAPAGFSLAFTPETTTLPFDLIMNKSISDAAKAAGIPHQGSRHAVSEHLGSDQRLEHGRSAQAHRGPLRSRRGQPVPGCSGEVLRCLLAVRRSVRDADSQAGAAIPDPAKNDGIMMGNAAVTIAKSPHFPPSQTWVVMCTDSTGDVYARKHLRHRNLLQQDRRGGAGCSGLAGRELIECPSGSGPLSSRIAMRNWLSAHPRPSTSSEQRGMTAEPPGMVQALNDAGFKSNGIVIGGDRQHGVGDDGIR